MEALSQIRIHAFTAADEAKGAPAAAEPSPTIAIGADIQPLHIAEEQLPSLCGAIDKRLTTILDKYQEASHLLDKHLESIVTPLILLARDLTLAAPIQAAVFSALYTICKVRGYVQNGCAEYESSECAHVSINEVACYRTKRTLMGCADPPSKGCRGYHHQCFSG